MRTPFTPIVEGLPSTVPFVGPEFQERQRGRPFRARIGANESVFGPAPSVIEAMRCAAPDVWMYCDPNMHDLRMAIADHHGVPPETIVIGEGIDGLFGNVVRLFVGPGDNVVTSLGAYPTFNYHVAGFGGSLVTVPYKNDHEDPDALLEAARTHRPKLVFLANPDNPMGTWHKAERIEALIRDLPDGTLLCLDEAYAEFAPDEAISPWDTLNDKVIRFRTFSKAYGLAGMRIAYAVTHPDIALAFDRVRNHFGVNRMAQVAAIAALKDQDYLREVVANVAESRRTIATIAESHGLSSIPSATNFVAVDCGRDGDYARAVLKELIDRDVFVRMPGVDPMDRCIRVGVGRAEEMEIFAEALAQALAATG